MIDDDDMKVLCGKPALSPKVRVQGVDKLFVPRPGHIFVFGSNLAGIHGAGAARYAYQFAKAHWGVGEGLAGDSYAIPTKDKSLRTLPLEEIKEHVDKFLAFAWDRHDLDFFITRIGCGLAGYTDSDIAPMFTEAPRNCELPYAWEKMERNPMIIDSFTGAYRFLSNFWPVEVVLYDVTYKSVEHAYQAAKTVHPDYLKRIREAKTPSEAKRLGNQAPLRIDWESVKLDFMRYLVWEKFIKHEDLKQKLLSTGNAELIEGNYWGDTFWGVCKGEGHNWLGKILMEVREKIRNLPRTTGSNPST